MQPKTKTISELPVNELWEEEKKQGREGKGGGGGGGGLKKRGQLLEREDA